VPAQLLGDWFLPTSVVDAIPGLAGNVCPLHPSANNCFFQLTLTATTYRMRSPDSSSVAGVVVNNDEIDFFNDDYGGCSKLPGGVGRYKWTVTGAVLNLTLISDPCVTGPSVESRVAFMANQSFYRTH
jgi:hypothetical protein